MEYLSEPFTIQTVELDNWEHTNRVNTFFTIVCILEGEGDQYVNNLRYPYKAKSIFLLPSSDCHTYKIRNRTRFMFLKFPTRSCFKRDNALVDYSTWFNRLNFIIGNYGRKPGELIRDEQDRNKVIDLLMILQDEYRQKQLHGDQIMQSMLVSVLGIITRNIEKDIHGIPGAQDRKINQIIRHIQHNLSDEQIISVKHLASTFHIAESYFSEYFKRSSGETFQDFVIKSKLKIAEARAIYTLQSIKEIAYDLGFTDSSHLNKMMKKYQHNSLSEIRKTQVI